MICQKCGKENPDTAKFCYGCGESLNLPAVRYCPACGSENEPSATFCASCGVTLVTKQPPTAPVTLYQPPGRGLVYAGFWMRFVAYFVDSIVLGIVFTPLYFVLLVPAIAAASGDEEAMSIAMITCGCLFYFVEIVALWLYFALMESSVYQATLGKMALGIIVTDLDGNRIGFGQATGRFFGKIVSGLILSIGYIMAGFTEKKQALHDIMAGCLVIMKRG